MEYSIYKAKAHLSEVMRMVKARRRVVITERGVPIAEILPYAQNKPQSLADRIAGLVKAGAILPHQEPFRPEPLTLRAGAVERFLQEDRE
jgi:prevent-host-death family protein